MSQADIEFAAALLGARALPLLGIALLMVAAAVAVLVGVIRLARRVRPAAQRHAELVVAWLLEFAIVRRAAAPARMLVPGAYLAIHLTLGFLVAAAIGAFAVLAEEVLSAGEMAAFDVAFAGVLREHRSDGWEQIFRVVTTLGGGRILTLATAVVGVWLFIGQQKMLAIAWGMSQALSGLLMGTLKSAFARTRPEFADPLIGSGWSFPSGHAMGTFVFCAVGCYLLLRGRRSWPLAVAVVTAASGWCVIMAFSRLYLGVHYVSDVIAGMLAGMAWSAVSISAMEILRTRYGRSSRRA